MVVRHVAAQYSKCGCCLFCVPSIYLRYYPVTSRFKTHIKRSLRCPHVEIADKNPFRRTNVCVYYNSRGFALG
jgi:hypothetical protein